MTKLNNYVQRTAPQSTDGQGVRILEVEIDRETHKVICELRDGKLSVFFPSYKLTDGREFEGVPVELRPLLDESIRAAYKQRITLTKLIMCQRKLHG